MGRPKIHGHAKIPGTGRRSDMYGIWQNMIQRCHNPKNSRYARYGGRGIYVCDHWRASFQAFLEDMGPRPSLQHSVDRIDNDRGYEPGNCRWATPKTQQSTAARSIRLIEVDGEIMALNELAASLGLTRGAILYRLARGIPLAAPRIKGARRDQ